MFIFSNDPRERSKCVSAMPLELSPESGQTNVGSTRNANMKGTYPNWIPIVEYILYRRPSDSFGEQTLPREKKDQMHCLRKSNAVAAVDLF